MMKKLTLKSFLVPSGNICYWIKTKNMAMILDVFLSHQAVAFQSSSVNDPAIYFAN